MSHAVYSNYLRKEQKMKRTKPSSLLTVTAAVAGLAMGASIAMASHPAIQLFTYEEVASQFGAPAMPVVAQAKNAGMPYSPKATCTGGGVQTGTCHADNTAAKNSAGKTVVGYTALADHAFHAALGYNEWMDNSDKALFMVDGKQTGLNPQKPWLQSHGHNGKW
jgi:hypothetical protein